MEKSVFIGLIKESAKVTKKIGTEAGSEAERTGPQRHKREAGEGLKRRE